jgi:hypothetical protein
MHKKGHQILISYITVTSTRSLSLHIYMNIMYNGFKTQNRCG